MVKYILVDGKKIKLWHKVIKMELVYNGFLQVFILFLFIGYIYYGEFKDNKKEGYGIMKKSNK